MIDLNKGIVLSTIQTALALVKSYVDDRVSTLSSSILELDNAVDGKLPLTGGTLTGDLVGKSITGTWLQATASNHNSTKQNKIVVQDSSGRFCHRTAEELKQDIGAGNCDVLFFTGKSVAVSAWASNSTYEDYPYRAAVSCSGVTANHFADVVFGINEAVGGNFAPICQTASGAVYIWAKEKPTTSITVQIEARKTV